MNENEIRNWLRPIRCFFLDMDGTVYLSENLIDGTMDFMRRVLATGRTVLFLTNNSSHSDVFYRAKLKRLGIPQILRRNLLTSTQAAEAYIQEHFPGQTGYVCANRQVRMEIEKLGGKLTSSTRLGKREFARPMQKQQGGHYGLIAFRLAGDKEAALHRTVVELP